MKKMTQDEFAEFMAKRILCIECYQFDVLYDISRIMIHYNKNRGNTGKVIKQTFHLCLRDTGCDMITPDDTNYKTHSDRSDKIYSMEFCWNYSYNYGSYFCELTRVKG